jgi:hypothetical protein
VESSRPAYKPAIVIQESLRAIVPIGHRRWFQASLNGTKPVLSDRPPVPPVCIAASLSPELAAIRLESVNLVCLRDVAIHHREHRRFCHRFCVGLI